jgi:uncharacterized membrane protein YtjA (UPF0391 family)
MRDSERKAGPLSAHSDSLEHRAGICGVRGASRKRQRSMNMLKWAVIFFLISVVAGLMGFTGIAVGAAQIAKVLFFICITLFLIFLVIGLLAARKLR